MSSDPQVLEGLNRDELIAKARQLGAKRPELLTRPELRDEIIRLSASDDNERRRARGWFGVARDLVASVVSQGLNLPDTADLIRGVHVFAPKVAPPVATVTLAEIYAAQGHVQKALDLLDEVLATEPDHEAARHARDRWARVVVSTAGLRDVAIRDAESESGRTEQTPHEPPEVGSVAPVADDETPEGLPQGATFISDDSSSRAVVVQTTKVEDRILIVRTAGLSLLCHWQLAPRTISQVQSNESNGELTLRVIEVQKSWDGPVTSESNIAVTEATGHCSIALAGADTDVRVALGWLVEQRFIVLALAAEFSWDSMNGALLRWAPPASMGADMWQSVGGAAVARVMQSVEAA